MNIESQVCSLDLARRLRELGVAQNAIFHWAKLRDGSYEIEHHFHSVYVDYDIGEEVCSAFSVAELGAMIPERIDRYRKSYIKFQKIRCEATNKDHYLCSLVEDGGYNMDILEFNYSDENEANARVKMLIHLIENGHVSAGDL